MNVAYLALGIVGLIFGLTGVIVGLIRDEEDYLIGGAACIFAASIVGGGFGVVA